MRMYEFHPIKKKKIQKYLDNHSEELSKFQDGDKKGRIANSSFSVRKEGHPQYGSLYDTDMPLMKKESEKARNLLKKIKGEDLLKEDGLLKTILKEYGRYGNGPSYTEKNLWDAYHKDIEDRSYMYSGIEVDDVINFLKSYAVKSGEVDLYRAIVVSKLSNINIDNLGHCWSTKEGAIEYATVTGELASAKRENILMLHIKCPTSNIDFATSLEENLKSWEHEIRIFKPDASTNELTSITPLNDFLNGKENVDIED